MKNLEIINISNQSFESIRHIDELGNEYWEARELQQVLGYTQWRNFELVINKAKDACENSKNNIEECFAAISKTSKMPNGGVKTIINYKLSRYACYLIVQNGDSRKEIIALGQTYFAVQTRKQELTELEYANLNEDERRLYKRDLTKKRNYTLNQVAKEAGVKNFGEFHNAGYKGLYNGETANDIFKRKGLKYREDILDNMCSEELSANEFRISQTEAKLKRDNIKTEVGANETHFEVGTKVRKAIESMGGTMPEELPMPIKSLKQIEKENINKLLKNR